MNGWQRIGVVLSLLLGFPAFLLAYSENDSAYLTIYPSSEVEALEGQAFWDALWLQAYNDRPEELDGCDVTTVRMRAPYSDYGGYSVSCEKGFAYAARQSILWGLLPGAIVFAIGYTIAWIIAGFRRTT